MPFPPVLLRAGAGCLLGAVLGVGCGSSGGSAAPSRDASADDAVVDDGPTPTGADGAPGDLPDAAATDAAATDADDCKGVRCAPPPPCDQPCTTACCCDRSCPPAEAGADGSTHGPDGGRRDAGDSCTGAGGCRLFSDMCGACTCLALAASAPDPVCPGQGVSCFRDPCSGQTAACVGGQCAAQGP